MARHIPVRGPLPDIADHVVETIGIWRKATDRRCPLIAILIAVIDWEDALPAIGDRLAVRVERLAPLLAYFTAAARGKFPLRLGRQLVATPFGICKRILIGDMHRRVIFLALDRRTRTLGLAPIRAFDILPPLGDVAAAVEPDGRHERDGARSSHVCGHTRMGLGIDAPL